MTKFYGKTKTEQDASDMAMNREIVSEVMRFGVKQPQILHIIKLLALELEDREQMQAICESLIKLNDEEVIDESTALVTG